MYDVDALIDYRKNRNPGGRSLSDEHARLVAARADLAELELAQRRGELVLLSEVREAWTEILVNFRSKLLLLPGSMAQQVADCSATEAEARLRAAVHEAIDELRECIPDDEPRGPARTGGDAVPTAPGAPSSATDANGNPRDRRRAPVRSGRARRGDSLRESGIMDPDLHVPEATGATADRPSDRAGRLDRTPPRR